MKRWKDRIMDDVSLHTASIDHTDPVAVRKAVRAGEITGETSGLG